MGQGTMHRSLDADVAVVGAGPAGAAAAAALADVGLRVHLVDPAPDRTWTATYGAWEDELPGPPGFVPVHRRWDTVMVRARRSRIVDRAYVVMDNAALAGGLRSVLLAAGGAVRPARVHGVQHFTWGSRLLTSIGGVDAGLVVDASGASSCLTVRLVAQRVPAVQAAWGLVARFDQPPGPPGACVLMDWSGTDEDDPTFLYAMDLGDRTWLVEETSLARRPALAADTLRRRLDTRLRSSGAEPHDAIGHETVSIPLDLPVPSGHQPVVAFGAAGGLVHPATGYSVAASLRAAPRLAAAVRAAVERRAGPAAAARAAWAAVWPGWRRRARALERYGLDALLRCRRREMQDFFETFFDEPPAARARYLAGEATPREVAALMGRVFADAPASVRRRLVAGDLRPLFRALA